MKYQFRESVTWNKITSSTTGFRYKPTGTMFDVGGLSLFPNDFEFLNYFLAFCNSVVAKIILEIISPTLNCETGHVGALPIKIQREQETTNITNECIESSRTDWDSFETSWDFKKHPLI